MKRSVQCLLLSVLCLISLSCSATTISVKGIEQQKMPIEVNSFHGIQLRAAVDVYITQSDQYAINVTGPEKGKSQLKFHTTKDGILEISNKSNPIIPNQMKYVKVYISAPKFTTISLIGAGDIEAQNKITQSEPMSISIKGAGDIDIPGVQCPVLSLSLTGAGDVDVKRCEVETLTASLTGAGDIDIKGRAKHTTFHLSGTGDIDAKNLHTENLVVTLSGMGGAKCTVTNKLSGKVNRFCGLTIYGNPANRNHIKGKVSYR